MKVRTRRQAAAQSSSSDTVSDMTIVDLSIDGARTCEVDIGRNRSLQEEDDRNPCVFDLLKMGIEEYEGRDEQRNAIFFAD